jgi:prephenate dehydratase
VPTVAFQGEAGAFSDAAARKLVNAPETRGYETFNEVIDAVRNGAADYGVLPVENTIVGPIADSQKELRRARDVRVLDELRLPIEMCVIGLPGTHLEAIAEIHSLPVALDQVQTFASRHGWRQVATSDTAGAVREVIALNDPTIAAVGPALAAELYGGKVLARGIQDDPNNQTRFVLITRSVRPRTRAPLLFAAVPVIALTVGVMINNRIEPRVWGLPFVLAWIAISILLTPAFMWGAYLSYRR